MKIKELVQKNLIFLQGEFQNDRIEGLGVMYGEEIDVIYFSLKDMSIQVVGY